jgi:hypothetical protein
MSSSKRKTVTLHEDVEKQKKCHPGPNVIFPKGEVPFSVYLIHNKTPGSLGCTRNTFPKYKNGKYCCESTQASDQEIFDYVNQLLQNVITNVSDKQLRNQEESIHYLLSYRNMYKKKKYPRLEDHLELPPGYSSLEDWMEQTKSRLEKQDIDDRAAMNILRSDRSIRKIQNLESLNQRVLLERDIPAERPSIVTKNPPLPKPKSVKKTRSRSSSKSSGGKTRKKK